MPLKSKENKVPIKIVENTMFQKLYVETLKVLELQEREWF